MATWRHLLQKYKVFGCLENDNSKYVILGIPLDQTGTYKPGSRFAPDKIRDAACNLELYSITADLSIETIGFMDLGDIVISPGDLTESFKRIKQVIDGLLEDYPGRRYIFIGGEHLITYPVIDRLRTSIDRLIVFDAHTDLRDEYLGSRINHATYARRIIEEYKIPVTFIGVRAFSIDELDFIRENRDYVEICSVRDALSNQ